MRRIIAGRNRIIAGRNRIIAGEIDPSLHKNGLPQGLNRLFRRGFPRHQPFQPRFFLSRQFARG